MFPAIGVVLLVVCLTTLDGNGEGGGLLWKTTDAASIQCGGGNPSAAGEALKAVAKGIYYESAQLVSDSSSKDKDSGGFKKFLHSVQCSLEKVKPWAEELEHEVRRIEETAKRISFGILQSFGKFFDKLVNIDQKTVKKPSPKPPTTIKPSTTEAALNTESTTHSSTVTSTPKETSNLKETTTTTNNPQHLDDKEPSDVENEIFGSSVLCPEGFVVNIDGICEKNFRSKRRDQI